MDRLAEAPKSTFLEKISTRHFRSGWKAFIIIFFLLFVILPTVWVLSYIFTDWSSIETVMGDPDLMSTIYDAILASFEIAAIVTVIDIIVGLPMAWILVRKEFRGKRYLDTLIDMPLAVPTAALGFSCAIFWAATSSNVNAPGFAPGFVDSAFLLIVLLHVVFSYPYMVRSLAAILEQIDVTYETAGRALGATKLTAARTITLPLFRAGLVTGIILCMARSLSETGGTMIALATMANSGNFETGPTLIGAWKSNPDLIPQLAFVSILLIVISLILLIILKIAVMKIKLPAGKVWPKYERILSRGWAPFLKDSTSSAFLFIFVLIPSFFIFTYVVVLPYQSAEWGLFWDSLFYSFIIAGVVTVLDIIMGVPMALYVARGHGSKIIQSLDVLVNVPLIVPTAALGFSLGMFWGDVPGIGSFDFILIVMAHVAFTYPLVVRNVAGAVEEIDPSYEETARTLGAKPLQAFRRVLYPMIKTSILAGAIMAFTRSLGETGATLAVVANANTAPVYIVDLINTEQFYTAGLACIVLIIVSYVFMVLLRYITKRRVA
ncbi:MAG: ABC transporter permease subunit [Euryarchaeota archaeon]|nr:ABC transporter permease subunit [Euryarchaeota archaeon]